MTDKHMAPPIDPHNILYKLTHNMSLKNFVVFIHTLLWFP